MTILALLDRSALEDALNARADLPVSLALIDLDHFKGVNDALGHDEGDRILRAVERLLTDSLPAGSLVARVGGDEYAVAFPDTPPETALILLDEVQRHFSANRAPRWPENLGLSIGIAARPAHATGTAELFRAADEAVLRAKREGRGRTAIYVESKMVLKSNYFPRAALERLSKLSAALGRTEASLLREALEDLVEKHRETL